MNVIVVVGNDKVEVASLKRYLAKELEIKDLGTLKYFIRINVSGPKQGIFLSQRKYVLDLLKESGIEGCKKEENQ